MIRIAILTLAALLGCCSMVMGADDQHVTEYALPEFGCKTWIPDDWTIHREKKLDVAARVSFGLPEVWSELEEANIENAVSISAYKRPDIGSLDGVAKCEDDRVADITISSEQADLDFGRAVLRVTEIRGIRYKSLETYALRSGVAFVFAFTATPGTYDRNVGKFIAFLERLEFFDPIETTLLEFASPFDEAKALYRAGPFNASRVISLLELHLAEDSLDTGAMRLMATTLLGVRRFSEALATIDRATMADDGISPHLWMLKAKALFYLGRLAESKEFLEARWAFFQSDIALQAEARRLLQQIEDAMSDEAGH